MTPQIRCATWFHRRCAEQKERTRPTAWTDARVTRPSSTTMSSPTATTRYVNESTAKEIYIYFPKQYVDARVHISRIVLEFRSRRGSRRENTKFGFDRPTRSAKVAPYLFAAGKDGFAKRGEGPRCSAFFVPGVPCSYCPITCGASWFRRLDTASA